MKKLYLMMAAVSALGLTACTSEDDVVQSKPQTAVTEQPVGFDVFVPQATNATRSGLQGTMTTGRLQRSEAKGGGFGVYAYLVEDDNAAAGTATDYVTWMNTAAPSKYPNFMVNEKLLWNATNQGWYYNPLKYWPNETDNDSQTTPAGMQDLTAGTKHTDRLSFFAYAPYVKSTEPAVPGITRITNNKGQLANSADGTAVQDGNYEPTIGYRAAIDDPNKAVDLLWGVAPAGGLTYTAVDGKTVNVPEGQPLIDMVKPDVNTSMKFLFQHALARIGVTAVAAIDQVSPGGTLDPNTKITIKEIKLTGYFGTTGLLNLDNPTANVANWIVVNNTKVKGSKKPTSTTTLTLNVAKRTIAEHLRFVGTHDDPAVQKERVGVTTVRQNVIEPNKVAENKDWISSKTYAANELAYSETTPYYTDEACETQAEVTMPKSFTIDSKGVYTEVAANEHFKYPKVLQNYKIGIWEKITTGNIDKYTGYQPYTKVSDGVYSLKTSALAVDDYVVDGGLVFQEVTSANKASFAKELAYEKSGSSLFTYTPQEEGEAPVVGDYVICGSKIKEVPYYGKGSSVTLYKRDANYFMVVPINNFGILNTLTPAEDEELRTVTVKITYYITTEDSKLVKGRAQTENVVEKKVVFPSIANGKSYNLNLVLGLTSVKMEAEVDDWKVINVQGDLPQNTAGE